MSRRKGQKMLVASRCGIEKQECFGSHRCLMKITPPFMPSIVRRLWVNFIISLCGLGGAVFVWFGISFFAILKTKLDDCAPLLVSPQTTEVPILSRLLTRPFFKIFVLRFCGFLQGLNLEKGEKAGFAGF